MKYKVLVFGELLTEQHRLRKDIEEKAELLILENHTSLKDVIVNWQPHLVVIAKRLLTSDTFELMKVAMKPIELTLRPGLIVLSPSYSMEEERNSFLASADHYLLAHSPSESILMRFFSVCHRVHYSREALISESENSNVVYRFNKSSDSSLPISINHNQEIKYEDLIVWPQRRSCAFMGKDVKLTPSQFRLLVLFLNHQEELLTRDVIRKFVWENKEISLRSIDAHIAKLKRRLPILDSALVNVYGEGYRLRSPRAHAA